MNDETNELRITNRLLSKELEKRGWKVKVFHPTLYTPQAILQATKDNREFFYASTLSPLASACGYLLAEDKSLTYRILENAGIFAPDFLIIPAGETDLSKAEAFLRQHKCVVVKPTSARQGRGVTLNIVDKPQLIQAISTAREAAVNSSSPAILIQQQVEGREYRFLVVDGKCIAVANRRPAFVIGDGKSTIKTLIEEKNQNPLRGDKHSKPLTKISIDEVARVNNEAFLDLIPEQGQTVEVLQASNISRGGEATNYTDTASSELKKLAESATAHCQLGIAGVDIITKDIHCGKDAYVIEINSSPGLRMHMYPSIGEPIDVVKPIIDAFERHATKRNI